jgi:hypothetical protein
MNVNYNYTGYYAIQVNYLNNLNSATDEYSNIPGNGIISPTSRTASLANEDQKNTSTSTVTLTGYNSFEVLSTNIIMYYDVEVLSMQKIVSQAISLCITGNVAKGTISGILKIEGNQPIYG